MSTLAADHRACAAVLEGAGSSFALPIRMLPTAKRRGTTALYAFCRRADDIVDDGASPAAARQVLADFEADLTLALAGGQSSDPVIRAVVDTVRRFAVPAVYLHDIIDGVRMDLEQTTFDTAAQLEEYCRRVASAVGVAAIHIWGFRNPPQALPAAHACGLAFQWTNILRDIPEDLARGRVYLPLEDFHACDCSPDDLRGGRIGAGFEALARLNIARARDYYRQAARLDRLLSTDGRIVFRAMYGVYSALFSHVQRAGTTIFTDRVRSGRFRLAGGAVKTLLLGPRAPRLPRGLGFGGLGFGGLEGSARSSLPPRESVLHE
jgi:phytoene synthase